MSKGKAVIIAFSALCLTQTYFSASTTTPNNWREGLMGQVPTLGIPFRREETTIKRGWKKTGGQRPLNTPEALEKAPWIRPRINPFWKLSLTVKNTVLIVVHTLKPNSLALSTNSLYRAHWPKVPCILGLA